MLYNAIYSFKKSREKRKKCELFWVFIFCGWLLSVLLSRILLSDVIPSFSFIKRYSEVIKFIPNAAVFMFLLFTNRRLNARACLKPLSNDTVLLFYWFAMVLSSMFSDNIISSFGLLIALIMLFVIARLFLGKLSEEEILLGTSIFSTLLSIIVLCIDIRFFLHGRQMHHGLITATSAGGLGMLAGCLAFSWNKLLMLILTLSMAIGGLLITNSRAAIVGMFFAITLYVMLFSKPNWPVLLITVLVGGAVLLMFPPLANNLFGMKHTVFHVDDEYRGLNSGFTGRFERWEDAWHYFLGNPTIGYGVRSGVQFKKIYSAHNIVLNSLLEIGCLGTGLILILFLRSFIWLKGGGIGALGKVLLSVVIASCVRGVFDSEFINCVTPLSIFLVMWLEYSRKIHLSFPVKLKCRTIGNEDVKA